MEKVEVLVITPETVELKVLNDDYKAFKEAINITSPIDCVSRKIGKKYYDIWLDDEGLFKTNDDGTISGIGVNTTWEEIFAGNLIIANNDGEGNVLSLSEDDIDNITKHIVKVKESFTIPYNSSMGWLFMTFKQGNNILIYNDEQN